MKKEEMKKVVRERYAGIAKRGSPCCAPSEPCCGSAGAAREVSEKIGYSAEELAAIPEGADLGLGCGNPVALASLREGETVLDLGSGAGVDCFLAAGRVGEDGRVIGVDMTPEMIERARANARKGGHANVEFRLGEIENLPVADGSVDAVISNCVINLSPDKRRVFDEAFRALKPGGRLMVSDIVLLKELPESIKDSVDAYAGCISGAMLKEEYLETMRVAGFHDVKIMGETVFPLDSVINDPTAQAMAQAFDMQRERLEELAGSVRSVSVCAVKPSGAEPGGQP